MFKHRLLKSFVSLYIWLTERLYHELAFIYDPMSWLVSLGKWDYWRKRVLDYATESPILEIGFGTGELLLEMGKRDMQAIGLDASVEMHRQTRRKMQTSGIWLPRIRGITGHMPFANESFSVVLSTFPASNIFEIDTWHEIGRVLHKPDQDKGIPGGSLVVIGMCAGSSNQAGSVLKRLVSGPPLQEIMKIYQDMADQTGLELRIVDEKNHNDLPILIAQRKA